MQTKHTAENTEASAVKVTRKNGMEVKRFNFVAVEARKHFAKDSVVDVNASGNVIKKYKAGVDVFIEIKSDGIGSWEVASTNDDGYGSGSLCIENNEVVDFDGAFDLPWRVKNMLTALGYKLTW
jgi:hypothetical protein